MIPGVGVIFLSGVDTGKLPLHKLITPPTFLIKAIKLKCSKGTTILKLKKTWK